MFSLAFANQLSEAKRILLAGAGGGYDLIGAVPLFHELQAAGKAVHLASLTFSDPASTPNAVLHPDHPILASVQASSATPDVYCPEAWLAKWLAEQRGYLLLLPHTNQEGAEILLSRVRKDLGPLPMGATLWLPERDDLMLRAALRRAELARQEAVREGGAGDLKWKLATLVTLDDPAG